MRLNDNVGSPQKPQSPTGEIALVCDDAATGAAVVAEIAARGAKAHLHGGSGRQLAAILGDLVTAEDAVVAVSFAASDDTSDVVAALRALGAAGKAVVVLRSAPLDGPFGGKADRGVWEAVVGAFGGVAVYSHRALLDVAIHLASQGRRSSVRAAIITFGGGSGVLATDLCVRYGLETPSPSETTVEKLRMLVPAIASIANPFDLTPEMLQAQWFANFVPALEVIAADPGIDTLFFQLSAMSRSALDMANAVADAGERTGANIAVAWTLGPRDALALLAERGVFAFPEPLRAVEALAAIAGTEPHTPADDMATIAIDALLGGFGLGVAEPDAQSGLRIVSRRHPEFGPVIGCAIGGALGRRLGSEPQFLPAPVTADGARRMLDAMPILKGLAKMDPIDFGALSHAVAALSWTATQADYRDVTLALK
ncbi:MAG TPA: hypothetical protein VGM83_19380 [Devosiaceae bacterium]|jgi:hypothetical protein